MDTSDLAKRMKEYEAVSNIKLMKHCPVVCRLDGRAWHSWTKSFKRPFDEILVKSMQDTMKYLCENVQGCVCAYTQSDEITLVLVDYKNLNTNPFFEYKVQKMCSILASMATMAFNKIFVKNVSFLDNDISYEILVEEKISQHVLDLVTSYYKAIDKGAMFDCRVFNLPKEEVTNCIYWRQLDATRNSIQMVGQANFSHKELQNKSCNDIQDMLMLQKGTNWNDLPTHLKRGSCCIKETYFVEDENGEDIKYKNDEAVKGTYRSRWIIDTEIPIFKGEGRKYIDDLVYVGE